MVHPPPDDRRDAEQPQRGLGDVGEARGEHLVQGRRQAPGLRSRGDELLGEERVALRSLEHGVDEAGLAGHAR